jgi:hypothetical protein
MKGQDCKKAEKEARERMRWKIGSVFCHGKPLNNWPRVSKFCLPFRSRRVISFSILDVYQREQYVDADTSCEFPPSFSQLFIRSSVGGCLEKLNKRKEPDIVAWR